MTWGDLDAQVDAVAAALSALALPADGGGEPASGVAARVAIALPNAPEFVVAFFGTLRSGLVAVPVNTGYSARELKHVLADSGAQVLIATSAVLRTIGDQMPDSVRFEYALGRGVPAAAGRPTPRPFADLLRPGGTRLAATGGEDVAVLLYTSGTEGVPKGAMLSHRALLANHEQVARLDPAPVGPDDVVLLALPLFHAYGLNSGLGGVAYHGACGVLAERFDPADTLEQIERHGVSVVLGVPPMYIAWSLMGTRLRAAFSRVRLAICGAAPLDVAAARRFAEATGRPIHEGYGLTETAPVVTSTLASPVPKVGCIGRPVPGVDLKLVSGDEIVYVAGVDSDGDDDDEDDDWPGTPYADPGEIVVRGPNVFSGYWPDGRGGPDAEGWWATGDVAYADADGDLFLVDRLGELILVSGFNVYPHEVEQVLCMLPGIVDAAAVGVPHPYTGQTVKVYLVTEAGAEVSEDDVIAHCERNLARFKCPTAIEFVTELPRSVSGKVRKAALQDRDG
jgi:long-chain acyl-CoA synthetase